MTYIVAAYVRLYPCKWFDNKKLYIWRTVCSVPLSWLSILVVNFVGAKVGFNSYYHMVANENKFLALVCSFLLCMLFKNIKIKQNRFNNTVAASTFGVILIHANSDTTRQFLWGDLLKNASYYNSSYLIVHSIASVIAVYVICICIDQCRILFKKGYCSNILKKKIKRVRKIWERNIRKQKKLKKLFKFSKLLYKVIRGILKQLIIMKRIN